MTPKPLFLLSILPLPVLLLPILLRPGAQTQQQPPATTPATTSTTTTTTTPAATIPAAALRMVNPVKPTPQSLAHAKAIYGYDCAMCHGDNGNGHGDLAAQMKLSLPDLTKPASLQGKTDGEIFYVIDNGQGAMPAENGRAKPEDMWNMVVLVRSFSQQ